MTFTLLPSTRIVYYRPDPDSFSLRASGIGNCLPWQPRQMTWSRARLERKVARALICYIIRQIFARIPFLSSSSVEVVLQPSRLRLRTGS